MLSWKKRSMLIMCTIFAYDARKTQKRQFCRNLSFTKMQNDKLAIILLLLSVVGDLAKVKNRKNTRKVVIGAVRSFTLNDVIDCYEIKNAFFGHLE